MLDKLTQLFKGEPLRFIIKVAKDSEDRFKGNTPDSHSEIYDENDLLILANYIMDDTVLFNQVIYSFKAGDLNGVVRYEVDGFEPKFVCVNLFKNSKPMGEDFFDWFVENNINPLRMSNEEKILIELNGF